MRSDRAKGKARKEKKASKQTTGQGGRVNKTLSKLRREQKERGEFPLELTISLRKF